MGLLVPDDFPLSSLANDEERAVVTALRDRLSDDWSILPDVGLATSRRDHQIDIVAAHPRDGIVVIEVKGHRFDLRDGRFFAHGAAMTPQPDDQARGNSFALRDRLREQGGALERIDVEYAIAFPNTLGVSGRLPADLLDAQVFTSADVDDIREAVDQLVTARGRHRAIGPDGVRELIEVLRPNARAEWDEEAVARRARRRMDELCAQRVRSLEPLDANRRVVVTGGAGSGKSHLAVAWARRAATAGDRVLLTCFNDPLAADLRERLEPHERLRVGSFFEVALALEGMEPLERPVESDTEWWDLHAVGHLLRHWPSVTERFDVVIVDEAQDFSPAWLAMLAQLLDGPDGRLMLLADEAQRVFARGFSVPTSHEWTVCRLEDNCRNTFGIATVVHRHLGGARPLAGPDSLDVRWREATDLDAIVAAVGDEIDHIEATGYATPRVLVATTTRSVRDVLRARLGFGAWEQRDEHTIVCENVQRMKGLEFDYVVLATDEGVADLLLYVGVSRAVVGFCLVAPATVVARVGLDVDARTADRRT